MLDVRGNCCIASCMTQPFVWRGSTRVPCRFLRLQEAVLFVWRGSTPQAIRGAGPRGSCAGPAGPAGPTRVPRGAILHCAAHTPFGFLKFY